MGLLDKFKKTTEDRDQQIRNELDKCNSLNEMIKVMNKYYNLDQPIPPMLKKIATKTISDKMKTIITFLTIKER